MERDTGQAQLFERARGSLERERDEAFRELHRRYGRLVRHIIRNIVGHDEAFVDDLAQEVWMKYFRFRARYDGKRPFGTWLGEVTKNVVFNYLDSMNAKKRKPDGNISELPCDVEDQNPGVNPYAVLVAAETAKRIDSALRKTSPVRHSMLAARTAGLSSKEIAERRRVVPRTVNSAVFNARKQVERLLKEAA